MICHICNTQYQRYLYGTFVGMVHLPLFDSVLLSTQQGSDVLRGVKEYSKEWHCCSCGWDGLWRPTRSKTCPWEIHPAQPGWNLPKQSGCSGKTKRTEAENICIKCICFVTTDFHSHWRLLSLSINASIYLSTVKYVFWCLNCFVFIFCKMRKAHYYFMGLKCAYSDVLCIYLCLSSVQPIMQLFVGLCALAGGGAGG